MALNTFADARPRPLAPRGRQRAAVALGADALIVADTAVMAYCRDATHPALRLHLSVQASATSHAAIEFYPPALRHQRAVLPRVADAAAGRQRDPNTDVDIGYSASAACA